MERTKCYKEGMHKILNIKINWAEVIREVLKYSDILKFLTKVREDKENPMY